MDSELRKQLELHSAGATVQHAGPYSDLEVPSSMKTPSKDFIKKWITPFYNWGIKNPSDFIESYFPIRQEVDRDLISSLLIWFNWRSRIVGAYFAAIEGLEDTSEHIG
ncbi:MAG: hypothetical protein JXD22_02005 [Sedimentisphaerales bacterium]|nr:hypothetical protein [Sedimentisphaerales bacterium]